MEPLSGLGSPAPAGCRDVTQTDWLMTAEACRLTTNAHNKPLGWRISFRKRRLSHLWRWLTTCRWSKRHNSLCMAYLVPEDSFGAGLELVNRGLFARLQVTALESNSWPRPGHGHKKYGTIRRRLPGNRKCCCEACRGSAERDGSRRPLLERRHSTDQARERAELPPDCTRAPLKLSLTEWVDGASRDSRRWLPLTEPLLTV